MINKPLLRKVMEKIEEIPEARDFEVEFQQGYNGPQVELWDQENWVNTVNINGEECGTAACFAGWTALLAGAQVLPGADYFVLTEYGIASVSAFATRQLGLDESQADALFCGGNTKKDLRRIVDRLLESEE